MFCANHPKTICFLFSFLAFVILLCEQVPFHLQSLIFCDRIRLKSNTNSYDAFRGISSLLCGGFEASREKGQTSDPFERIQLQSPDRTIRATFIPFGATLVELWVQDRNGVWRDVVLGYDDLRMYKDDPAHPYFGSVVGRYANRIKNGRFKVDNTTFQTTLNENNQTTLHGGKVGFDRKTFKVEHQNSSSVTFILYDKDGSQGYPASTLVRNRYSLENNAKFFTMMDAEVLDDKRTPIMLSSHIYWALHGYTSNHNTILDHQLYLPKANKYIRTDEDLIPTGEIVSVKQTPLDFQTPKTFSETFDQTQNLCGKDCTGWDTCLLMENDDWNDIVLTLTSPETGIRMNVKTDQTAIQLYTCNAIYNKNFNVTRKHVHGDEQIYENHSCLVIELEDYIDAINNPEWGKNQIYSNQKPFHWQTEYSFSQTSLI